MFGTLGQYFGRGHPPKATPLVPEPSTRPRVMGYSRQDKAQTFTKVFRWRLPDGEIQEPDSIEVVGTFTHWQKVPLLRDGKLDAWHVSLHHIQGNRTHHYMILVNGVPTIDKTCDGFAVPHGSQEEKYQVMTDKGPRVLMLFAQTR